MKKTTQKKISLLIALAMVCSLCLPVSAALDDNDISLMEDDCNVDFPDQALSEYMVFHFDTSGDGKIQKSELHFTSGVSIEMPNTNVSNTSGLEEIVVDSEGWEGITFNFANSQVYNIAPLFTAAANNPGKVSIYLDKTPVDDMSFGDIPHNDFPPIYGEYDSTIPINNLSLAETNITNLSYLSGYEINSLNITYCSYLSDANYTTASSLGEICAAGVQPNALKDLVPQLKNLWRCTLPGKAVALLPDNPYLSELNINDYYSYDTYNSGNTDDFYTTNDDFKSICDNICEKDFSQFWYLKLEGCSSITDMSPLNNLTIQQLDIMNDQYYRGNTYHYNDLYSPKELNKYVEIEGKILHYGDYILEQIVALANAAKIKNYIQINSSDVTDLSPLAKLNWSGSLSLTNNYIALEYKDNKAIYDDAQKRNQDVSIIYQYGSYSYYISNTNIQVTNLTSNRKSFINGDIITQTLTLQNNGSEDETISVYFNILDGYDKEYYDVDILSEDGLKRENITIPAGKSITQSISFKTNKFSTTYLNTMAYITNGVYGEGKAMPYLTYSDNVKLYSPETVAYKDDINLQGICAPEMSRIEIQTEDGKVLSSTDNDTVTYGNGTSFESKITVPDESWPASSSDTSSLKIKAVVYDSDNRSFESGVKTINLIRLREDFHLAVDKFHYMAYGSSHQFGEMEPSIMYWGDRVISRIKLSGVDDSDIQSVKIKINNQTGEMKKLVEGKYAGYYTYISNGLTDGDYLTITVTITTTSGEVVEKFLGYGRILIDPSGIITDPDGNPIEGVKVTLYRLDEDTNEWYVWDAWNYLQENPVYTNEKGKYGWDVPEGTYKIKAEKEGYKTVELEEYDSRDEGKHTKITVLPPRLDVDFTMEYADSENKPIALMSNEKALETVQAELEKIVNPPAETIDKDIIEKLRSSLSDNMYVSFKSGTYQKTDSTKTEQGNIKGTLIVENLWTGEMQETEADITLAAIVSPKYNVTLNTNGGVIADGEDVTSYTEGEEKTLPTPTKDGYTFAGWHTDNETFENKIEKITTETTGNLVLYAKWTAVDYTITKASVSNGSITVKETANKDENVTITVAPETGYELASLTVTGDNVSMSLSDGLTKTDDNTYTFTMPSKNINVSAEFVKKKFTVTYKAEGAEDVVVNDIEYGTAPTGAPTLTDTESRHYLGWVKGTDTTADTVTLADEHITENTTYTAKYVPKYTVTFSAGDGELTGNSSVHIVSGEKLTSEQIPTASKTGYNFTGWSDGNQTYTSEELSDKTFEENTTITAQFEIKTFTVTFNKNGAESADIPSQSIAYNATAQKPENPAKEGYTFMGWTLNNQSFSFDTPITDNIELVALWSKNQAPKIEIPLLPKFNDQIKLEMMNELNEIIFIASKKNDILFNELDRFDVYMAEYDTDNMLTGINKVRFTKAENENLVAAILNPESENYKVFIWTDTFKPIMGVLDNLSNE